MNVSLFSDGRFSEMQFLRQESNGRLKSVMLCKLLHRACFALTLIALAGDIEINPGYQTFVMSSPLEVSRLLI